MTACICQEHKPACDCQAKALPDPRSPWQRRTDALWKAARRQVYLHVYCRRLYQPHMRLIHRWGWHWHTHLRLIEGDEQLWCQWCGDRWTRKQNRWAAPSRIGLRELTR